MKIKEEVFNAQSLGLIKFLSENKCRSCGGEWRYARCTGGCVACRSRYGKKSVEDNQDKKKLSDKRWKSENKEYLANCQRAYRARKLEEKINNNNTCGKV